jgi:hypothetical protein
MRSPSIGVHRRRVRFKGRLYRVIPIPEPITDTDGVLCNVVRDDIDRVFWVDSSLSLPMQAHCVGLAVAREGGAR